MTTTPEHFRPFNLEHAIAGAPVGMKNGWPLEIHSWTAKLPGTPIVGVCGEDQSIRQTSWYPDGRYGTSGDSSFDLVMLPLGFIDGKPVFVGDEIVMKMSDTLIKAHAIHNQGHLNACTWPAPAKVYPETRINPVELVRIHDLALDSNGVDGGRHAAKVAVANAALRHAIDAGQVMLPGGALDEAEILKAIDQRARDLNYPLRDQTKVLIVDVVKSLLVTEPEIEQLRADLARESRALGIAERTLQQVGYRYCGGELWKPPLGRSTDQRAARDMAIAEAVRDACYDATIKARAPLGANAVRQVHLTTIIAEVAP